MVGDPGQSDGAAVNPVRTRREWDAVNGIKNAVSVGLMIWGGVTLARLVGQMVHQRRLQAYQRRFRARLAARIAEERAREGTP